jgi:hypothetical protein
MQSGAGPANDRLVLVLLNIPPALQPMLDVHTSCWAGEDQYCHQSSLHIAADRALIWRKAGSAAFYVLPFLEPVANGGLYFGAHQ